MGVEEKRDIGGRARCTENEQEVHFKNTVPLSKLAPIPTAMTKATQNRVYYSLWCSHHSNRGAANRPRLER